MIHYNYDCDFKIAEQLIAEAPFRYTYYAKSEKTVVAEYDGTDYHGCYPMGDMLIVPINAGSLGLGEVKVRREYYLTDKDFTDGICNRVTGNVPLGIEIWRGETDGMETHEVKVVPAYQKGDPFTFDDMTDAQKQDIADRVPTKEPEREKAEAKREQNELRRQANEAERETKEAERQSIFSTNEAERQQIFETNEAIREENETKRVDAEILRQEAETIREATYKNKVDRDDNAPKLTAGFANNLVGRGEATPQEISFRPSGGDTSIEDGTARIDRVKGSTVVWNQCDRTSDGTLTKNGITFNWSNGVLIVNGTATADFSMYGSLNGYKTVPEGRKAYSIIEVSSGFSGSSESWATHAMFYLRLHEGAQNVSIIANSKKDYTYFLLKIKQGDVFDNVKIKSQLYDLTKMFGEGNEPTTIEEFNARKPIGIDEYAYNEGELISNNVDEIKSVGFNAWDEEWENGRLSVDNGYETDYSGWRSKSYIHVIGGVGYSFTMPESLRASGIFMYEYDVDKTFLGARLINPANVGAYPFVVALKTNTEYIRISDWESATYNHDICIHLAHTGYRNGEYEPYKEFRRNIPIKDIKDKDGNQLFPNGLLSAGSVYDEVTPTKAIKRIGVVDAGTLYWYTNSQGPRFVAVVTGMKNIANWNKIGYLIVTKYEKGAPGGGADREGTIGVYGKVIYVQDNSYTDVATFKASMSGVMLYYELEEPIEVDLPEPLNLDYEVSDFGTEEVISDAPTTPMKADVIYQFNAVDRIRDNSRHTAEAEIKLKGYDTRIAALEAIVTSLTSSES